MRLALALVEVEPDAVRDELMQWLLEADDPAEVCLVRDALAPHAGVLKQALWRQAHQAGAGGTLSGAVGPGGVRRGQPGLERQWGTGGGKMLQANALIWASGRRPSCGEVRRRAAPPHSGAELFPARARGVARSGPATVVADYLRGEPGQVAELCSMPQQRQFAWRCRCCAARRTRLRPAVTRTEVGKGRKDEAEKERQARRRSSGAGPVRAGQAWADLGAVAAHGKAGAVVAGGATARSGWRHAGGRAWMRRRTFRGGGR